MSGNESKQESKEYLIALNDRRSKRALLSALAVSLGTFIAVVAVVRRGLTPEPPFRYFTVLSNLLSATGAMFMLPYAVEGIRKKRFTLPRWISLFQYAGAVTVFITMFCAAVIIMPAVGVKEAYGGPQIWLHLIIPVLAIVLFLTVESGMSLTKRDILISQTPFWAYAVVYFIMVYMVGKDRGGWGDIYEISSRFPLWVVLLLILFIGIAVAVFLRFIHNRAVSRVTDQFTARWDPDITDVELKIEAYGLGRYMAQQLDESEIDIPMDIFRMMTERFEVSLGELTRAYTSGVMHGIEEKERGTL